MSADSTLLTSPAILRLDAYEIRCVRSEIYRGRIAGIEPVDFRYARELGYAIKLVPTVNGTPEGRGARASALIPSNPRSLAWRALRTRCS